MMAKGVGAAGGDAGTTRTTIARKDAFFGIHFDLHPGAQDTVLGRDATGENIAAFLDRVKPDFVQYDCKGHAGYTGYPSKVGYPSPGIVKDALRLWRAETLKRGISLYIHYSGVWDTVALAHHPEWARVNEKGERDGDSTSVFGDYARELLIPQLKEVTSEYALDGVWVDGDCWAAKLDYSPMALAAWEDKTGTSTVPRKRDEANWQEWKTFNREGFENYVMNWVDELHRFNPALELCSNWAYTPHMPIPIRAKLDFLSGDFSAKESADRARFEARYLQSNNRPWDLMAWGFNMTNHSSGPQQWKPAAQLMQEAAVVLALGGGVQVYYQPTRSGYVTRMVAETVGQVADFCRARQSVAHKSRSLPQVALLLSTRSYLDRMDGVFSPGGQYNDLEGALHVLLESGYSVDLMAEHQLVPQIEKYPVVAIAQAPVLDADVKARIVEYVRSGGKLVLLDWESAEVFSDLLGVEITGGPTPADGYIGDLHGTVPAPGAWVKVQPSSAEVVGFRVTHDGETTQGVTADGAYGYRESVRDVAATRNNVGEGCVVAVYGPVAGAYFRTHHPWIRNWVSGLVRESGFVPRGQVLDNPNVDMSLRILPDGREAMNLVNLSGAQRAERFAAMDRVPPSGGFTVEWVLDKPVKKFVLHPENKDVKFEEIAAGAGRNHYRLMVKDVNIYSVIIPEYPAESR